MNNSPFNWNNQTTFIPAKLEEKKMSTYDYLKNAESELRNALKSTTNLTKAYQLRRIADTIGTIESIKHEFKYSVNESMKVNDGFFTKADGYSQKEPYEEFYGGNPCPSPASPDTIKFNLSGSDDGTLNLSKEIVGSRLPGGLGDDHIIFG